MVPLKFEGPCAAHFSHGLRAATANKHLIRKLDMKCICGAQV